MTAVFRCRNRLHAEFQVHDAPHFRGDYATHPIQLSSRAMAALRGRELDCPLIHELWAHSGNLIAVRFACEWRDDSGHWFRSYGNEN